MSNSAYLKKYVENHPKNKMAWYLLGKEYEANGQEGKAHYCYIQAGSVFEAFESSKMPADLWKEYQENLLLESRRKEKRHRNLRKAGIAAMLLLVIWLPSAHAPGNGMPASAAGDNVKDEPGSGIENPVIQDAAKPLEQSEGIQDKPPVVKLAYTAKPYFGDATDRQKALGSLFDEGKDRVALETAVLGMKRSGKWAVWSDDMPVVFGVKQSPETGAAAFQSYDAKACDCTPPDVSELQQGAGEWTARQESLALLSSAMKQYKLQKGQWPAALKDLTGSFPDNWIAGSNPVMKEAFKPMLEKLKQPKGVTVNAGEAQAAQEDDNNAAFLPGVDPFFDKPLEVIVDTKNHTLAVVSGNIIVRIYKVGLGGEKTPEGTYRITDKVVNPNGRDDGEFGSRGMQLSDTNYAIHGTNEPESIGKDQSLGCVRMSKQDVEELFDLVPKGTKVTIGKGILPKLESVPEKRFALGDRQDQTNPHRTYHWLD
ncbi:L,D-transpeptidase-like protein [Fontibacillus phaseoli]|uniref:L,D-transpeptidase-like protein n=1 Tax=Fontibacillus phaseoli TaxID=1416533 RepID=A0A369BQ52_9BACL|nr:L,D-transpeptidase family protein [Fontibacillus phaseoli]RCX21704.1 L,D-transpeptidase-like protein [Fontibacillus phaseoli]